MKPVDRNGKPITDERRLIGWFNAEVKNHAKAKRMAIEYLRGKA